jgi:hypothetical protein
MTQSLIDLPPHTLAYVRGFARRRAAQLLLRRAGLAALVTIVWAVAWCLVDRALALPAGARLTLLLINAAACAAIIGHALLRFMRPADLVRAAREIERRESDWHERLATLVSRALGPPQIAGSPQLLEALAADVDADAARRIPTDLLPWNAPLRPWIASAVAAASLASLALIPALDFGRLLQRYAMPLAGIAPAATTRLFVTPGVVSIPAGEALRVRASVQRMSSGEAILHVRAAGSPSDAWITQPMSSTPSGAFEARVPKIEHDLEYFVTGGDARSDVYRVAVLHRPAVVELRFRLDYPPYLKLPPRELISINGVVEAPAQTRVRVEIEASTALSRARFLLGNQSVAAPLPAPSRRGVATFVAERDEALSIEMTSAAGVEGRFTGGRIIVAPDRPPAVTIEAPPSNAPAPRVTYHAIDDLALARIDAEISRGYGQQKSMPIALAGDVREQSGVVALEAGKLELSAGEVVDVQFRVEDRAGQFTLSEPVRMSVLAPASIPDVAPSSGWAQSLDLPEFKDSLHAYFRAISSPSGR